MKSPDFGACCLRVPGPPLPRIPMPFRVSKSFTVETGHLLTKHPGACRFPHGHSRTITVVGAELAADALDARDMVCDFKAIKLAIAGVVERYDHAFALNTTDARYAAFVAAFGAHVIGVEGRDPTSEVLAREVFGMLQARLRAAVTDPDYPVSPRVRLERVRVTETATTWAEYWE